jgi:hypothetical protein
MLTMKKVPVLLILPLLLILAVLPEGCTQAGSALNGSGKIIDRNIDISDFDSIEARGIFEIEINNSDSFQVTLSTDDNLINRVLLSVDGKTLLMKIEAAASFFPTTLKVKIASPQLKSINLDEKAKATVSISESVHSFNLILTGGSSLEGSLAADLTNFYLSGQSRMSLQGKSKMLELDTAGASQLDLSDFLLSSANVKLRETSTAWLNVTGDLNVVLKDASKIIYLGNPLIKNTSITGDSSMIHQ